MLWLYKRRFYHFCKQKKNFMQTLIAYILHLIIHQCLNYYFFYISYFYYNQYTLCSSLRCSAEWNALNAGVQMQDGNFWNEQWPKKAIQNSPVWCLWLAFWLLDIKLSPNSGRLTWTHKFTQFQFHNVTPTCW